MPCEGPIHYRRATSGDAASIAQVHVDGWRRAHEELVPQEYLAHKSSLGREEFWRSELDLEAADRKPWVALDKDQVIGFADGGIARDEDLDSGTGEVYTLFVTPECWEKGIRSRLVDHVARDLRAHDFQRAVFWVLEADLVMRAFAEYTGWHPDGHVREEDFDGASVTELRYAKKLV